MWKDEPDAADHWWKDVALFLSVVLGGGVLGASFFSIWGRIPFGEAFAVPVYFFGTWMTRGPKYPFIVLAFLLFAAMAGFAERRTWIVLVSAILIAMIWIFLQWGANNLIGISY